MTDLRRLGLLALGVIVVDQLTKLTWQGVTNDGLAGGAHHVGRAQTIILGLLVCGALATTMIGWRAPRWTLALVLGGALSNIWDRVAYGAVRDFIPAGPHWRWNIADAALYIGLLAWLVIWAVRSIRQARGGGGASHGNQGSSDGSDGHHSSDRVRRASGATGTQVPPRASVSAPRFDGSGVARHQRGARGPNGARPAEHNHHDEGST